MAVDEEDGKIVPTNQLYSAARTKEVIENLTNRYPFIESGSIGKSVMGQEIFYLRLGIGKKQVFYNASFHANEWITTPVLLKFALEYADAIAKGERLYGVNAAKLYQEFSLYLVPMVNPDGVDVVNNRITDAIYKEQVKKIADAYSFIPFPDGWKANIEGVDLNLQFPADWELAKEIKYAQGFVSPAPRDYVGRAPLTAPESRSVYEFTRAHDFALILAYHTQGKVIYWKYKDYEPARSYEIGRYFSAVSGYALEETPKESANAGYKDWFIGEYNRPGYTIEAGSGKNPLPIAQFDEIYQDNIGILLGGMTELL